MPEPSAVTNQIPEVVETWRTYDFTRELWDLGELQRMLQEAVVKACAVVTFAEPISERCVLLADRLIKVEADLDAYADARLGVRPKTAWPIQCPVHGTVYLTRLENEHWASAQLNYTVCPICGRTRAQETSK
jgi:hypothetical protein